MLRIISLLACPLLPTVLALPTAAEDPHFYTETWQIPRINVHFHTSDTGLPGNPAWPDPPPFNSTIDFDLELPATHASSSLPFKTHCHAEFINGQLPDKLIECAPQPSDREVVKFHVRRYNESRRAEMSFSLDVIGVVDSGDASRAYWGDVSVEGNMYGEETMHMQCVGGAPMTGMKCEIYGGTFGVEVYGIGEGLD